ncbi:hypothetical protein [Chryseobacterium sp.]|uniref:HEAT repeat domain-containing protein n=1 Tax=Chryseobacterium sp. TaxID=1871047 RepID=UPI0025BB45C4|nr:hypothetical protein [Chryseobacterium sp.]
MLITTSIHFLFLIFLGMLLLVLLLIITVLFYSFYQYRESIRIARWSAIINKKISDTIVYGEDEVLQNNNFTISHNSLFRNLFLKKLVDSEKKFSGVAQHRIQDLFVRYNLKNEALKKLDQKKKHLIAGGIQELTAMNVVEAIPKISVFLEHPSSQVYQEAQYALVSFKGFEGLYFLDTISTTISEWQQLRLLRSLVSIPLECNNKIKNWLESENNSVVIFSLKLLRKFQLLTFYPLIINLLNHSSVEIRVQTIHTLLSLENSSTISHLIQVYPEQPIEVQLEILQSMKTSKDHSCTDFLKKELLENPLSTIKIHSAEALFSLGYQEYLLQLIHKQSSSAQLIQIIKYALQEKVC